VPNKQYWPLRSESSSQLPGHFNEHTDARGIVIGARVYDTRIGINPKVIIVCTQYNRLTAEVSVNTGNHADHIPQPNQAFALKFIPPTLKIYTVNRL
jgi:hypothetical protein